ncbi:MAG: class I SAM-dependent methyltransferase [Rubrimonas sp.]|uniref:class I SAM-dependent methyltransferase n=1 Tax=Rubrimonas sp. TaxID=2036015 RepID=UPI002FDE02FB
MSALAALIRAEIAADGPMSVARFMALCLGHPAHGYYMRRDPFGASGDFVTAPEISQMFGELLGLWVAQVWRDMGAPRRAVLAELGPGRGTLAADALRAIRAAAPDCAAALELWLVETSPALRAAQSARLPQARHAERLAEVPDAPLLLMANEFFDALPIRQFRRAGGAWRERMVAAQGDRLVWALGAPQAAGLPAEAPEGAVLETRPAGAAVASEIGARLAERGGAALIVDYGAAAAPTGGGDTLQAVARHRAVDPLASPGEADLTAHVDFGALAAALGAAGATVRGLISQGAFLEALGIGARAQALARARPDRAGDVAQARRRLTDPAQMGTLFKVLAATGPGQPAPPGFATAPAGETP